MKKLSNALTFICIMISAAHLDAETTDPVGAVGITIKGGSDTIVTVPLSQIPEFTGAVTSVSAQVGSQLSFNVSGTPGWTNNKFASLYYVRMTSGAKDGMYYTILGNTSGQLTIDSNGDDLAGIQTGNTFKVIRYWTLSTLFPPGSSGTPVNPLTPSASTSPLARRTEILVVDSTAVGINLSATSSYYFTSSNWYVAGSNAIANDAILYPDNTFTIRQPTSVANDVVWTSAGSVELTKLTIPLLTRSAGKQDNPTGLTRPVDSVLANSGLETGFVASTGLAAFQIRDALLLFDNGSTGYNKSAYKTIFRYNGNWYLEDTGSPIVNSELLKAGWGLVIRKYQDASANTAFWINEAPY